MAVLGVMAMAPDVQAQTVTTTTITSTANPATAGQGVTLTGTVTGSSPTGTVTFKNGAAVIGARTLSGTSATLSTQFTGGSHSLTAAYGGNAGNMASTSAAVTQTVNAYATHDDAERRAQSGITRSELDADGQGQWVCS